MIKVVVPVYNSENYLTRCVDSILSQTEHNIFIVLIDDGSSDHSGEICDNYAQNNNNIVVIHQNNKGLSAARNAGIELSDSCDYITFVDSDDWLHPQYLEALLKAIKQNSCSLSICGHRKTDVFSISAQKCILEAEYLTPEECYCSKTISPTPAWGKLYMAQLFRDIRYPVGMIYEDYYTTWKILFKQERIAVVPYELYYYYYNKNGLTHSPWNPRRMEVFPALEEQILYFKNNNIENALKNAITKYIKTTEKYISLVRGTEYEDTYLPELIKKRLQYQI